MNSDRYSQFDEDSQAYWIKHMRGPNSFWFTCSNCGGYSEGKKPKCPECGMPMRGRGNR